MASPSSPRLAGNPEAELGPSQLHTRNRSWLEAMAASPDAATRLWWRNALVEHNLALVRMVAQRHSLRSGRPFDDLVSAGCLGLIRAVEAFDLRQRCNLSSFAVPYIKGAMLHDVRDHGQPLHTPRRLRELQQRARRLQERRRAQGLPPLTATALACELGCSTSQLEEAAAVQRALQVRSLDAPLQAADGEEAGCLLDQLAAPPPRDGEDSASSRRWDSAETPLATCETSRETSRGRSTPLQKQAQRCRWLSHQLAGLNAIERRLLMGHWMEGLSWSELAVELQISSRQSRTQGDALMRRLQERACHLGARPPYARASAMASRAAMAV